MDDCLLEIIDIEAKECAAKNNLDADRVCSVFHRLEEVKWYAPNFPWATAFDEAIAYLGPQRTLEEFENNDLLKLSERVWIVSYLNNWLTPFYAHDELAHLIKRFISHFEQNRESLLETGFPRKSFSRSHWFDAILNRLLYVKAPVFHPLVSFVLYSGFHDPNAWQNLKDLEEGFTELNQDKNGNVVYDYRWAKEPHTSGYESNKLEDGSLFVTVGTSGFDDNTPILCSYEEAALLPRLDENMAARLEGLRPKFFDLKMKILCVLGELVRKREPWRLWEECACVLAEMLTGEDVAFLLNMDDFYSRLQGIGTCDRGRRGPDMTHRNAGISDLLDFIGHCEKELKFGSLHRTKQAFLGIPKSLFDSGVSSYYEVLGETWKDSIDKALDKFLLWEEDEVNFQEEYRERVKNTLEKWPAGKIPVNITEWIDPKHKNLYEPNIRSYANFQKSQLETTGQLAQLRLSSADGDDSKASPKFMSAAELASHFDIQNKEALRKRLERFRRKHKFDADAFCEVQNPGRTQARFLWNVERVKAVVEQLKKREVSAKLRSNKNRRI